MNACNPPPPPPTHTSTLTRSYADLTCNNAECWEGDDADSLAQRRAQHRLLCRAAAPCSRLFATPLDPKGANTAGGGT